MHEKLYTKEQVMTLIDIIVNNPFFVYSDKRWEYPDHRSDQKNCIMLDMNFNIEKKPGIVIHIPGKTVDET